MNKKVIGIITIALILMGVFSISITNGEFFFTTKYYNTPIDAYNSDNTYNAVYGNTEVIEELCLVLLNEEIGLFVGSVSEERFIVCEMEIRDSKYASKGNCVIYDLKDFGNNTGVNTTFTCNGYIDWEIKEMDKTSSIEAVDTFTHINGESFCVFVYKN